MEIKNKSSKIYFELMNRKSKIAIISVIIVASTLTIVLIVFPLFFGTTGMNNLTENLSNDYETIYTGNLVKMDDAHFGSGEVQLIKYSNGSHAIYFIDVEIANGPALYVYLSKKSEFSGIYDSPGEFIDLGTLPAQSGTFEVKINDAFENIESYKSVLIWCLPFSVVFSYATLN